MQPLAVDGHYSPWSLAELLLVRTDIRLLDCTAVPKHGYLGNVDADAEDGPAVCRSAQLCTLQGLNDWSFF